MKKELAERQSKIQQEKDEIEERKRKKRLEEEEIKKQRAINLNKLRFQLSNEERFHDDEK